MDKQGGKRKSQSGKCVHCHQWFDSLTMDHVFPKAWYPKTMSSDLEKWKIPSCWQCNQEHGLIESRLLVYFGLQFSRNDPDVGEIAAKAANAIDPKHTKHGEDPRHRQAKREKIARELRPLTNGDLTHALTEVGPEYKWSDGNLYGVLVNAKDIETLAVKIVKGLAYIYDKTLIGNTHNFEIIMMRESIPDISNLIQRFGGHADRGPAIQSQWAFADGDPASRLHYISIWKKWNMYVSVTPKNR